LTTFIVKAISWVFLRQLSVARVAYDFSLVASGGVMNVFDEPRRSFLMTLGALAVSGVLPDGAAEALEAPSSHGYVLGPSAGEQLVHFRDRGRIVIKAGSATGSVSPAGLDGFFRDTCSPPGTLSRQLTRDQINEIARKYGTEFK
jgi:hypothetical protein